MIDMHFRAKKKVDRHISQFTIGWNHLLTKGGFKSEETEEFLHCQDKYSKSLSLTKQFEYSNKLFTDLGRKFKFSAEDSDLEYLFW